MCPQIQAFIRVICVTDKEKYRITEYKQIENLEEKMSSTALSYT